MRNSGLDATSKVKSSRPRWANTSVMRMLTISAVPTGTVDLSMMIWWLSMCRAMVSATARTYLRSAEPSSSGGVPTAMN
ncbi:hypothetical protein D3C84_1271690 [compost metagenome]